MKERPEIHIVEAEHEEKPSNPYLLGKDCLIDTGVNSTPEEAILPFFRESHIEPSGLSIACITHGHGDHSWGLDVIKRLAPAITSMAHELDVEWIEYPEPQIQDTFNPYIVWPPDVGESLSHLRHIAGPGARINVTLKGKERPVLDSGWDLEIVHC